MGFQLLFSLLQRNTADHQQIKKKKKITLFISCWNKHWNYLIPLQLVQHARQSNVHKIIAQG
jgi:ABC-type uncharacterized transport system YnjBCD substrate-binding protein